MVEQVSNYHVLQPHPLQTSQETRNLQPYSASTLSPPETSTSAISAVAEDLKLTISQLQCLDLATNFRRLLMHHLLGTTHPF
jgi:hypothetical protein